MNDQVQLRGRHYRFPKGEVLPAGPATELGRSYLGPFDLRAQTVVPSALRVRHADAVSRVPRGPKTAR
jgi:hypothetical protein